jgi:hypothetical protein
MKDTLSELMTQRHEAYLAAKAKGFEPCAETAAWRRANRAYVTARTARTTLANHGQGGARGVPRRRIRVPRPRSRRRIATILVRHSPPTSVRRREVFATANCQPDEWLVIEVQSYTPH